MNKNKRAKINWYSKKHGITLISLVITIVIMLILAGVAVSISVGDGSVTQHAQNATEQWNAKVNEEQISIDEALGYLGIEPATQISDQMPAGKGWDNSATGPVDKVATQSGKIAPIPKGYTVSQVPGEGSISGGMVVYQIPTGATVDWAENEITLSGATTPVNLQENVNQYVWIPVDDINDMVMCKCNGSNKKIDGTATEGGKKICELVYDVTNNKITCTVHGYDTTITLSDDSTSTNFIDKVGLAGRVYEVPSTSSPTKKETTEDNKNIYTLTPSFKKDTTFSANSDYREPAIVTGYDKDDATSGKTYMADAGIGDGTVATFKAQLNKDFIAMAKSVAKYGGFYISRFEPSYDSEKEKVISQKNKAVLTATASTSGNRIAGNKWYGLYNKTRNETEKASSVSSHMVWGCQYDQVIKFLGTEAQTGHNYQTKSQVVTGYTGDQDILNNIYDLEGNNREWTAQAHDTDTRVYRGSNYNFAYSSTFNPASYRLNDIPTYTNSFLTTRPTLTVAL